MHDALKSSLRRLGAGWYWPLVLLALPNCSFAPGGLDPILDAGPLPRSSAVMCDVQTVGSRHCATTEEIQMGIPLTEAAIALTEGRSGKIGLDYSPGALSVCSGGPQAISFEGSFPEGSTVCLNCGTQIPGVYADSKAVCVAACRELLVDAGEAPMGGVLAYCQNVAHPSTNFPLHSCFDGACSEGGNPDPAFADPRRSPEPVVWQDLIGTADNGGSNTLTRTAPTTGPNAVDFNAGAASTQEIHTGDGFVEFAAAEANLSHVLGLSTVNCLPCADADPSLNDIGFAISLNRDGQFYVIESGSLVAGPNANGSFGTYSPGQRFRVKFKDNLNGLGTSTITYATVNAATCLPGTPCPDTPFYTSTGTPLYPLRIDASFREQGATLANVGVVRIQIQ